MGQVPAEIVNAINAMLAPYGETYVPGGKALTAAAGYKSARDAYLYLGISKSALYKLVADGLLHPIKLNKEARNGKVVFATADLEAYIAACRGEGLHHQR